MVTDPKSADAPNSHRDDDDVLPAQPEAADDAPARADDTPVSSEEFTADSANTPSWEAPYEEQAPPANRPPLIVIIGAALLLIALGAGLAVALVPPRTQQVLAPTAVGEPAVDSQATPATDQVLPTALPLPEAIGDANSTEVIAEVGDVGITRGEFVRAYQPGSDPIEVINQLIQVEIVVQQAASEGVTVDEAQVDAQIEQIKLGNGISDDEQFLTFLQQNNIESEETLRNLLRRDQLVEQMLLRHTTLEQAHARHILLATTAEDVDARKAEAEAILAEIEGGADFATVASEKSEDPGSQATGGDLGWAPRGMFVPPFDEAIFSMAKDEVRLVQTDFGWHIIQLIEPAEVRPIESRDVLNTAAGQQAFNDTFLPWVEEIKAEAEADNRINILVTSEELVSEPGQ